MSVVVMMVVNLVVVSPRDEQLIVMSTAEEKGRVGRSPLLFRVVAQ